MEGKDKIFSMVRFLHAFTNALKLPRITMVDLS